MQYFPEITEFAHYAEAFRRAARTTLRAFARRREDPDRNYTAIPVLFLYRHAVELYLKAVVMAGSRGVRAIDGTAVPKKLLTHDLEELLKRVESVEDAYEWPWERHPVFPTREDFRQYIRTLGGIDGRSFAFRYPLTPDGKAHFSKPTQVNLTTFASRTEAALDVLSGLESAAWADYEGLISSLANGQ